MKVEGDRQATAAATGGTDPHMGGDRRVGSSELPTLGHRQQPGVEASGVPDREKLLGIGAGSALTAQFFWNGQLDGEPAVRGPAVTCSSSLAQTQQVCYQGQ